MKKIYTLVILLSMGITQIYAQSCYQCNGTNFLTGTFTSATGQNSFVGGNYSVVTNNYGFVFGDHSTVNGLNGIALGNYANVSQSDGIAIGSYVKSNAANSYVFGQYLTGTGSNSLTFGIGASSSLPLVNKISNSIMFGVTDKPALTIVKKIGLFTPITVGYIGIGTDDPEEMVHVVGKLLIDRTDETASSLLFKHPHSGLQTSQFYWDIYSNTNGLVFNSMPPSSTIGTQRMIITGTGSVGIGSSITTPQAKLHVDNNILAEGDITTLDKFRLAPAANSSSQYWELSRTITGLNFAYKDQALQNILFIGNNGAVGIGKINPSVALDVNGALKATSATIDGTLNASSATIDGTLSANLLSAPSAKISGLICAKEVRVQLTGTECWPDYVFSKDYKLIPLVEVEQFITENQHLPNVPSSAEVEVNGVELGTMNATLLQKVEELTLYIIQMEKRLAELENMKGGK